MDGAGGEVAVPEVSPVEAHALAGGGAQLLDVREPEEWDAGHAPGARHVPLGVLGEHLDSISPMSDVVVICRSGGRSHVAATALRRVGYRTFNVAGGMHSWADAGLPVVTDAGTPGSVL